MPGVDITMTWNLMWIEPGLGSWIAKSASDAPWQFWLAKMSKLIINYCVFGKGSWNLAVTTLSVCS